MKCECELLDGWWDKNDTKEAAIVADLVSQEKCRYFDWPNMDLRDLRHMISLQAKLKNTKHGLMTRYRGGVGIALSKNGSGMNFFLLWQIGVKPNLKAKPAPHYASWITEPRIE